MLADSYLWTLEKQHTQMHQSNWKWGLSLPALQMISLSQFPLQFQIEVNQCLELTLISISVEDEFGPFFSRSHRSSNWLSVPMSYSEMWGCRVTSAVNLFCVSQFAMVKKEHLLHKRCFSCISLHRYFRPLQLSSVVSTTFMDAKFKGAMSDANPRYTCQTWLPCLGWLNIILHPCLCHFINTSLPDRLSTCPSC